MYSLGNFFSCSIKKLEHLTNRPKEIIESLYVFFKKLAKGILIWIQEQLKNKTFYLYLWKENTCIHRHITVKVKITFILILSSKTLEILKKILPLGSVSFCSWQMLHWFCYNSYCMVIPGTHLVKKHDPQCRTNESQFKKQQVINWKCLGLYVTRQLIWGQTPKLFSTVYWN